MKAFSGHIAARPSDSAKMPAGKAKARVQKEEHRKASMHAKVEHLFRVIKRQFGLAKVRFRGLQKNTSPLLTLFALSINREMRLKISRCSDLPEGNFHRDQIRTRPFTEQVKGHLHARYENGLSGTGGRSRASHKNPPHTMAACGVQEWCRRDESNTRPSHYE